MKENLVEMLRAEIVAPVESEPTGEVASTGVVITVIMIRSRKWFLIDLHNPEYRRHRYLLNLYLW